MMFYRSLLIALGLVVIASIAAKPHKMQRIARGTWGGTHIQLEVNARNAAVEYDCANGIINGPLAIDADGKFNWSGTHRRERGGPVRKDAPVNSYPAVYTGSIKGDTLTLTVNRTDTDEELGTFTLKRGAVGKVFKCL
jgi:hypothetical protein